MFCDSSMSFRTALLTGAMMAFPALAVASDATSEAAAEATAVPDIIVTAQKREERIQDVPIAISAFSAEQLDNKKIEGGSELLRSVPNLNFSKSFSSMYNVSIRGIGTKALNSTSDPGVAIAFNNTPMIRNRMFEQEFYDLQRVEVLRGPQGTLYGRNSTAGVINILPALPDVKDFEGMFKGETGSFSTRRLSGMLNVPLGDTLAIRGAGALTKRDGFDYNSFTNRKVNGRDLWSTRLSALWEPSSNFKASLIWEHFNEKDDRSRTGKALCTPDAGPEKIGNTLVPENLRTRLGQGCLPGSLYDDAAFGVPPGLVNTGIVFARSGTTIGFAPDPIFGLAGVPLIKSGDLFEGVVQSRDPRRIATASDPRFRARNDVFQFNAELGIGEHLSLVSQTAYSRDRWYSSQDYNRFISNPIFNDSRGLLDVFGQPYADDGITPGGIYTDPQLGASDRLLTVDINRTKSKQWNQEIRLQSSFDGPVNFTVGANYLYFKTKDSYYALSNLFTALADTAFNPNFLSSERKPNDCVLNDPRQGCLYIDRNPIDKLDDQGHNYFLSRNYAWTKSLGLFGEAYWRATDNLNITIGARYTRDRKRASQIPSQLLLSDSPVTGGNTNSGYPKLDDIKQNWNEFSGRFVIDWKPDLSFTDDTSIYFSASHGYKGGGANPPRVDFNPEVVQYLPLPQTYKPEFVNVLEIGAKNTLADGKITLNGTAFFYDYKNYQVSQVTDRITYTENFPAQVWGFEFEGAWKPSRAFQIDGNLGFLKTRLKSGARSIDVMNRTQGNDDWVVLRPWLQVPNNCIAPKAKVEQALQSPLASLGYGELLLAAFCPGSDGGVGNYRNDGSSFFPWTDFTGVEYNPFLEAPNGGRGFDADLAGNELPNAPRITFNIGAQYTFFINNDDWNLTLRADYYRQSKSYARVYNAAIDQLKSWDNFNISMTLARPSSDLAFQLYVKNVFDKQPITDVFLSADDIGMPANTFYLDPRIIGFNVSKKF